MDRDKWLVSLNKGGTLSFPAPIARRWGIHKKQATLWFLLEGDRVVVVPDQELAKYLRDRDE